MLRKKFSNTSGQMSPIAGNAGNGTTHYQNNTQDVSFRNFQNPLPEVYTGHPNRQTRYNQYAFMEQDAEIAACLDIIAEFSTQQNEHNHTPFDIRYVGKPTPHEVDLVTKQLQQWTKLNELNARIFKIFRNTLVYGDQVFLRDPETYKMFWVDMSKVNRVIVNESEGKLPEQYVLQDLNPNFQNLTVAAKTTSDFSPPASGYSSAYNMGVPPTGGQGNITGSRFTLGLNEGCIDAKHIVHLSLSEGLDRFWPFGQSILESIYKVYKQKELLEDAILIYRINRAPERRVFKIDVGNMQGHMAMAYVERVKNEIYQRRIPSPQGGAANMDTSYSPMSINEDFFFPHTCVTLDTMIPLLDGRTLSLENLIAEYTEGKVNWVYSINQKTFEMEPGKISWAGKTRLNAELVEVELDNGEKLRVTPDHRFIMRDGSEVEASKLHPMDSLMPLYLLPAKTSPSQTNEGYVRYINNKTGKKCWVHTTVCPKTTSDTVIHHVDFNSKNNNPENLIEMTHIDHVDLHKAVGTYSLRKQWDNPESAKKLIDGMRAYHASRTDQQRIECSNRNRMNAISGHQKRTLEEKASLVAAHRLAMEKHKFEVSYSSELIEYVKQIILDNKSQLFSLDQVTKLLNDDPRVITLWRESNATLNHNHGYVKQVLSKFPIHRIRELFACTEYKTWAAYANAIGIEYNRLDLSVRSTANSIAMRAAYDMEVKKCGMCDTHLTFEQRLGKFCSKACSNESKRKSGNKFHNHKVVNVKFLNYREDTGDITVEGNHNFATAAGVYIHNSDGRGSDVTTLPGGSAIGELDDLRYFNNKMARGLRVPSSYLPQGPEDNPTPLSDGRVGTAMIQEHRFNQYCIRLQRYLAKTLDFEFKLFLKWRGFNIDSSLFELHFNEPQNFASYRQSELDSARVSTFQAMEAYPYVSKRFALERFLGLSTEEINRNEQLWHEENSEPQDVAASGSDLRSVGISNGDITSDMDMSTDMDMGADMETPDVEAPAAPEAAPTGEI